MNAGSACIYVARWALLTPGAADDFAPSSSLVRSLLLAVPLRVWLWCGRLSTLVSGLLLPRMRANEITDGNVNFSFRVGVVGGRSVFVKQAPDFVKWQPQMALESARMAREVQYFRDVAAELGPDATDRVRRERHESPALRPAVG